jgi:hypothetical protein
VERGGGGERCLGGAAQRRGARTLTCAGPSSDQCERRPPLEASLPSTSSITRVERASLSCFDSPRGALWPSERPLLGQAWSTPCRRYASHAKPCRSVKSFEANSCAKCALRSRKSCPNSNGYFSSIDPRRSNLSVNDSRPRQIRSMVSQTISILWVLPMGIGMRRIFFAQQRGPCRLARPRERQRAENRLGGSRARFRITRRVRNRKAQIRSGLHRASRRPAESLRPLLGLRSWRRPSSASAESE